MAATNWQEPITELTTRQNAQGLQESGSNEGGENFVNMLRQINLLKKAPVLFLLSIRKQSLKNPLPIP